jgi:hypothetical protein
MSNAYKKAIEEYAPDEVDVVHDRFHLVSAMNDTIDAIRRGEQRKSSPEPATSRPFRVIE